MENILKKAFRHSGVGLLLLAASVVLYIFSPDKVLASLKSNLGLSLKIIYLTTAAVAISTVIHFLFPADFARKHFSKNKPEFLLYATILGILTPGPVYAIYPIVISLKKKGIQNYLLVSYITGQTIIGPARLPFELGLFGTKFFLYRLLLSVIMGCLAGFFYILLSKIFPDKI